MWEMFPPSRKNTSIVSAAVHVHLHLEKHSDTNGLKGEREMKKVNKNEGKCRSKELLLLALYILLKKKK